MGPPLISPEQVLDRPACNEGGEFEILCPHVLVSPFQSFLARCENTGCHPLFKVAKLLIDKFSVSSSLFSFVPLSFFL